MRRWYIGRGVVWSDFTLGARVVGRVVVWSDFTWGAFCSSY